MKRYLLVACLLGCGGKPAPATPEPTPMDAAPAEPTKPAPAVVQIPEGWTDMVHATKAEVDALTNNSGIYDMAQAMIARNGYLGMALDLVEGSPDEGAMMTMLHLGRDGTVDQAFLDGFIADNNLGLTADLTVESKVLSVGGRPIAKWRVEYPGDLWTVATLVYLFPDDTGQVVELVFVVRADRYDALRAQLEAIEG